MHKLYPNIEAERARRGLTVEQFTAELGVTRKTYYNWIANGKIPQAKLERMADFLDVSVDYLLEKRFATVKTQQKGA